MSNVIDIQAVRLAHAYDPDEVREGIVTHVAIMHPGQGVSLDGPGSLDAYPCGDFLGLTVTASTGMSLLVSIPADDAVKLLEWGLRRMRGVGA